MVARWCYFVIFINSLIPMEQVPVKIRLESHSNGRKFIRQEGTTTACNDLLEVNQSSLELRGMLNPRVHFYKSEYATNSIDFFLNSSVVTGLGMVTASMVLDTLKANGCPVFIFGGVVRDQFLGLSPNDVDVEVECEIAAIVAICKREWGSHVCGGENDNITHIGTKDDPKAIDLAPTNMTFYASLVNLEYTANSLAYGKNGEDLILDIPGSGVKDACNKIIRIPSDDNSVSSWETWYTSDSKLYRYWKLRAKGFTAFNNATEDYIIHNVMRAINNGVPTGREFKDFYCKTVYGAQAQYSSADNMCRASMDDCGKGNSKAAIYNMLLQDDLGRKYVLETLKLPNCTYSGEYTRWYLVTDYINEMHGFYRCCKELCCCCWTVSFHAAPEHELKFFSSDL